MPYKSLFKQAMVSLVKELLLKWQVLLDCLLLKKRKIREANTKGTGELIKDALDRHCQKIYLGIGGQLPMMVGLEWLII